MARNTLLILLTFAVYTSAFAQAKRFEPTLISNDEAFGVTISPRGDQLFYVNSFGNRDTLQIYQSKKVGNKWQKPELAFFSDVRLKQIDPFISPDGNTILFNSLTSEENSFDIFAVYKTKNGWTEPKILPEALNSKSSDFYATMSLKKNIYFTRRVQSNDIYVSYFVDNNYTKAVPLDSTINTKESESNPYISPKEDYLLFFSDRAGGYGDADLYISFSKSNKWSYPINLGDKVNSKIGEFCPSVDIRSNMLYFSRTEVNNGRRIDNIYSIDLRELKFEELKKSAQYKN